MANKIQKYSASLRVEAIKLAMEGHTYAKIAYLLGIASTTLDRYRNRDEVFNRILKESRQVGMKNIIDDGLTALAKGTKREETTDEYITEDDNGKPIKRKVRTIQDAPNVKALEVLSRKYAKEYTQEEHIEVTNNILSVDTSGMSLREVQEAMRLSPIEASSNIKDLDPPSSDGDVSDEPNKHL
tara:strand:+ start:2161 stop:2712 length:552 start_codon:yes stop_codon:yes gene_type:complete